MPHARTLKILIVDDQLSMRGLTRHGLEQIGIIDVTEAKDGPDALTKLKGCRFDLIISDWNMGEMTGLDLLKTVRSNPLTKNTPFVMATGEADKGQVMSAVQAGVNNYIVKPFSVATLKDKLEAVLGKLQ